MTALERAKARYKGQPITARDEIGPFMQNESGAVVLREQENFRRTKNAPKDFRHTRCRRCGRTNPCPTQHLCIAELARRGR